MSRFRRFATTPPTYQQLVTDPVFVDGKRAAFVIHEDVFQSKPRCYTFSFWMTLVDRDDRPDTFPMIMHQGTCDYHRAPGIWLNPDHDTLASRLKKTQTCFESVPETSSLPVHWRMW